MTLDLIVEESNGLRRAALVEGRRLVDLAVDRLEEPRLYQSLWAARIDRMVPKIGAFAHLGEGRSGLIRPPFRQSWQSGDSCIVQVKSVRSEGKADIVTTDIALNGQLFVYLPNSEGIRLSRQIEDSGRFTSLIEALRGMGLQGGIVRTAALTAEPEAIVAEAAALHRQWQTIEAEFHNRETGMLAGGPDARQRLLQDYGNLTIARPASSFEQRGLEAAFENLLQPRVALAHGASLIIERTAALTAIDVNTGTRPATEVNREAVESAATELRLRDLSGLILIDFAAPGPRDDADPLLAALKKAVMRDPAGCRVTGITPSGLVELTRARRDRPLAEKLDAAAWG